jgi:hypothetical protein
MLFSPQLNAGVLNDFQFREFRYYDDTSKHKAILSGCSSVSLLPTERDCSIKLNTLGTVAGELLVGARVGFNQDRLAALELRFNSRSFENIYEAFEEKYGTPCESSAPVVRNGVGASFTNDTKTWCFSDGKMTLSRYADKITSMKAYYRSNELVQLEQRKPPVDF